MVKLKNTLLTKREFLEESQEKKLHGPQTDRGTSGGGRSTTDVSRIEEGGMGDKKKRKAGPEEGAFERKSPKLAKERLSERKRAPSRPLFREREGGSGPTAGRTNYVFVSAGRARPPPGRRGNYKGELKGRRNEKWNWQLCKKRWERNRLALLHEASQELTTATFPKGSAADQMRSGAGCTTKKAKNKFLVSDKTNPRGPPPASLDSRLTRKAKRACRSHSGHN